MQRTAFLFSDLFRPVVGRRALCSLLPLKTLALLPLLAALMLPAPPALAAGVRLGPEGEHVYHYLVLTDALVEGDEGHIEDSIQGLLKGTPYLPVFQDGVTILLSRKNYKAAKRVAERGLKAFPDDPLLTILLSGVYSESGDSPRAVALLETHLVKKPDDRDSKQELVRLYLRGGEEEKAQRLLKDLGGEEESPVVAFFRCKLLVTTGNYAKAKIELQKLVTEYPEFIEAWLELGFVAEREDKIPEAVGFYRRALGIMHENPEVRFRIVQLLVGQKKVNEAVMTANQSADPAQFNLQAGLYISEQGYHEQGKKLIESARAAGAHADETALFMSLAIYNEQKDPIKALEPLESIPDASPFFLRVNQRKVELLLEAGKEKEAYECASRLRQRMPENTSLWGLEAYTLFKMGDSAGAMRTLQEALELSRDDEDLLLALGSIQDEAGKKADAMRTMERIVALNPRNARALNYIGYTLAVEKRDLDRALRLITTALEETPDAEYIIDSLAWVYYQMGRYDEAWAAIQKCLKLAGEDATIWDHYGDIATALGKKDKAVQAYRDALKLKPENELEIRSKLKALEK